MTWKQEIECDFVKIRSSSEAGRGLLVCSAARRKQEHRDRLRPIGLLLHAARGNDSAGGGRVAVCE
jgi:hypothetical protein